MWTVTESRSAERNAGISGVLGEPTAEVLRDA
jgi:hypothetical protein